MLGSRSDTELAQAFRRTFAAVQARRIELGIPKFGTAFHVVKAIKVDRSSKQCPQTANIKPGANYCTWTPEEDALLGQITDQEIAAKLGYSISRIRRRRYLLGRSNPNPKLRHWTKDEIALLGTRPDREVAALVKRSVSNVRYKRLQLGIPFRNPSYEVWKPDELALLGKLTDEEVAQRTGHSLRSILQTRRMRRI